MNEPWGQTRRQRKTLRRTRKREEARQEQRRPSATQQALGEWTPEQAVEFRASVSAALRSRPVMLGDPSSVMGEMLGGAGLFWLPEGQFDSLSRLGSFHAQDVLDTGFTEGLIVLERPLPLGYALPASPVTAAGTVKQYMRAAAWSVWGDRLTVRGFTFCDNQADEGDAVAAWLGVARTSKRALVDDYPADPWYPTARFWLPTEAQFPIIRAREEQVRATAAVVRHVTRAAAAHRAARQRDSRPSTGSTSRSRTPETMAPDEVQRVHLSPTVGDPMAEHPVVLHRQSTPAVVRPYLRRQHVGPGGKEERIVRVSGYTRGAGEPPDRLTVYIVG